MAGQMADTAVDINRLPLSILNYFAAFTETRFNFRTLINYRWTNDELTLDLSLFRAFTQKLIERIKSGDNAELSIRLNGHAFFNNEFRLIFRFYCFLHMLLNIYQKT